MLGFSYHAIMQVSAFRGEKKKPDQICMEGVIFGMQLRRRRGAIMQKQSSLLTTMKEVKGKTLTPLYGQWGQLCCWVIVIAAVRYCCPQCTYDERFTLHRSSWLILALQQAKTLLRAAQCSSVFLQQQPNREKLQLVSYKSIYSSKKDHQMPFTATNIIPSWDLTGNNFDMDAASLA